MAKKFTGKVKSDVQTNTCVVTISRRVTHPIYGKRYIVSKNVQVHDPDNKAKKGDEIEITEIRPVSKHKAFQLVRVLEASHGEIALKQNEAEETLEAAGSLGGEEK